MFCALEPCCAHALAKLKSETAANSTFPMLPPPRSRRPQSYRAACTLRWNRPLASPSGELEMIRTLMAVALTGAFALPAAVASAADDMATRPSKPAASSSGATTAARFDELDKNHDGFISRDEGKDAEELNTRFTELDTNNDNK